MNNSNEALAISRQRLLILSCSKSKSLTRGSAPAINLYDGPAFRVLRRFMSTSGAPAALETVILSAKHGFISPTTKLKVYDQRMQPSLAPPSATLQRQLAALTTGKSYSEVFVNLGSDYLSRLPDLKTILDGRPTVLVAQGRIGEKLHRMKEWLFRP